MPRDDFSRPFSGIEQELTLPTDPTLRVKRVQEWLTLVAGTPPGPIDGQFGPKTKRSLENWRAATVLGGDGPPNEVDWGRLTDPLRRLHRLGTTEDQGVSFREAVLLMAKEWANSNVREVGANNGPWVRAIMLGNGGKIWQWCAGFVCLVMAQAARAASLDVSKGPRYGLPVTPSFGVPQLVRSAKQRGLFEDGYSLVKPGDLFVIPTAAGSWSHVGFVMEFRGNRIVTIEGNTNAAGSSDGEVCRWADRNADRCDFILLDRISAPR